VRGQMSQGGICPTFSGTRPPRGLISGALVERFGSSKAVGASRKRETDRRGLVGRAEGGSIQAWTARMPGSTVQLLTVRELHTVT